MPWGVGFGLSNGGSEISSSLSHIIGAHHTGASIASTEAGMAAKAGGYARRQQEWTHQRNVIAAEITQLYKQLRAAQIR